MRNLPSPIELKALQQKIALYGDQQAFAHLFLGFNSYLKAFACSIVTQPEIAEEIVSDVFLQIWKHRQRLLHIDQFRLYLYTSTRNTAINYLNRLGRNPTISIDDLSVQLSSGAYNPEQLLITSEAVRKIDAAIQNLPPRCRAIFKLAKEDRLCYQEIATLLHISVNTIDNQMAIALKKISSAIQLDIKKSSKSLS